MKKFLSLCVALLAATQVFASYVPQFDDNGKCTIALSDLSATDGVTIDAKAGTITSTGKGEFYLDLPAEGVDLSTCYSLIVDHEGDDIVGFLEIGDVASGNSIPLYSSKYNVDWPSKIGNKVSAVNKMIWHCNAEGTMTVKSITLTRKVTFDYKSDETPLTSDMFHAWSAPTGGTDEGQSDCALVLNQELNGGGLVYGNGSVKYLFYAVLDGYKEIRLYGTPNTTYRVLLNRETDGGKLVELKAVADASGLAVCDVSSLPYVHLNAIKMAWSAPATVVKGLCVSKSTTTGIRIVENVNSQNVVATYTLTGRKVSAGTKGLVLQKSADGKVIKHINR